MGFGIKVQEGCIGIELTAGGGEGGWDRGPGQTRNVVVLVFVCSISWSLRGHCGSSCDGGRRWCRPGGLFANGIAMESSDGRGHGHVLVMVCTASP